MKLSFAISLSRTKFAAISSDDWQKSIEFMKKLGFDGVELAIRNPDNIDRSSLRSCLLRNNMELVAIGTGQAYVDEGLSLSSLDREIRKKAVYRMQKQINLAAGFRSYVVVGLIRGILDQGKKERGKGLKYLVDNLKALAAYAAEKEVKLLIEPLNRYETNIMNRADETVEFLIKHSLDNYYLLLDTFHMNIEEKSIIQVISSFHSRIGHVHIADSNRLYPGAGNINLKQVIKELKRSGYKGYLSGEYLPLPDVRTAIKKYITYMRGVYDGKV